MIPLHEIQELAAGCGFGLAGAARAEPVEDHTTYAAWAAAGMAGEMSYLTDHRAGLRADPRRLLETARSVICVGRLYNHPVPYSTTLNLRTRGWISRYAWGEDYHTHMRRDLGRLAERMAERYGPFDHRICVDTAPVLERSLARLAGLGWIGRNTCLINEPLGSWFFLGELLAALDIESAAPPPDRCGSCTACIDACPTQAIVPTGMGRYTVDSRLCISYFTIELRGSVPEQHRPGVGHHVFGCDICQDVCPWNRRAPVLTPGQEPPPPLAELADLTEAQFRDMFRPTPVSRARYSGFLRNVAIAMGNSRAAEFEAPLRRLESSADPVVAEAARWALQLVR